MSDPEPGTATAYLVTGATGFIGRHLMERLVARPGARRVFVLVRSGSLARHGERLAAWRATLESHGGRLEVLAGDVTEPDLGLSAVDRQRLEDGRVQHVVHLAAHYDLEADAELLDRVNRGGTAKLIALLRALPGYAGTLHHVSSVAVGGDHGELLREDELELGQGFPDAYHRTKYEAERLVRGSGLRFRVYRPSAVVGHSRTGACERVDGPYYLLSAIRRLRDLLPRWITLPYTIDGAINMVPVDHVADALDAIVHNDDRALDGRGYHLVDPDPPGAAATFNLLADAAAGPRIRTRRGRLLKLIPGGRAMLGQLGAVKRLRANMLADNGIPRAIADAFNTKVRYDTGNRDAALAGTGVRCPPQARYVAPMWDYWLRNLDPQRDRAIALRRRLEGEVVLITGASSGIGAALAEKCGAAGARVVLVARRAEALETAAAAARVAGGEALVHAADLSDMDACDGAVAAAIEAFGRVDILVNNAARSIRRPLPVSLERFHDFERVMQLNYFSPVRLIRGVLPGMRARRRGHIVNVLSAGAIMPSPRFGVYGASKAALSHLTDTLGTELLDEGVETTGVFLPWVRTPMMDATGKFRDNRAMTPDQAADWILDGILKRRRHVLSGETRRHWVENALAPVLLSRILNTVYRIYADDPEQYPEFETDRALIGRFYKGRPF